ncbi:LA2681 family HEPN domain-containing protein [Thiomicrorhabdus sp.]|uniref:LA2681 family HEPN domain-containing protein n=1 Tax=Thiomicrorhabdus sp. TaxID=2039724 RepID=UPI002AA94ACB|nr:LA2681 family HEPN domain-containing protein [Thiomicrorhabdus sp.]
MEHPNLVLRELYWLSKDFVEQDKQSDMVLGQTMEPDADRLRSIRNHLEHKFLKVHDEIWLDVNEHVNSTSFEQVACHLSLSDLSAKTLRLMKLARAALMYLSLEVHREEEMRAQGRTGLAAPITLPTFER